jgi:hypothetical protein
LAGTRAVGLAGATLVTRRLLIPSRWYCKYCYQVQPIEIGGDASLIVCCVCRSGLAPFEDVYAAGSMRTWWEQVQARWAAR